ncbi:MAG: proline dehydrogenase [Luteitalea sp.]|nr:proline dehydrogenase [Luteitalea sp.]
MNRARHGDEDHSMGMMRSVLLAGSESRWLRHQAPRLGFVKKAVSRFMPGEQATDALNAAAALRQHDIATLLTYLGENIADIEEAARVTQHYADVLRRIRATDLDSQISVKLTQLGLDVDKDTCLANLLTLVESASLQRRRVWIDMEQHTYVDVTLELYRQALAKLPNVGVCLQAYLYRTASDLASLIPLGGGIRLVKGAYRESPSIAYPHKADVDQNYLTLAKQMIAPEARAAGLCAVFGTHDERIIQAIQAHASTADVARDAFEFALLFGVQRTEQMQLAAQGYRVRVLISYGEYWFPWYMRRLAERPANVWFVARSLFAR